MALFSKFNQFVADLAGGIHNLLTGTPDTFYILLTNTLPVAGDSVVDTTTTPCTVKSVSNAVEVAAGYGYTKGGLSCGSVTGAQASGTFKFTLVTDPVFTAAGGSIGPFQYVVLYNASKGTAAARPVIGFWAYPTSTTLLAGETFTVDLDQTNGVLTVT